MAVRDKTGKYFKENWEKQGFFAEILLEKEFVSCLPWGTQLQPIAKLCHVTHESEVEGISTSLATSGQYKFVPRPKKGKCGRFVIDGSPLGESYRGDLNDLIPDENTVYTAVSSDQHLLPNGGYSWWGVEPVEQSRYGSCKFSVNFKDLLRAFEKSHNRFGRTPSLRFLKAGTLRYRYEICYVILVHASTDDDQYIRHLPPLTNREEKFEFHDLLNGQGVVTNWQANDPVFELTQSGENVAFGFYFSPDKGPLQIPEDDVTRDSVEHPHRQCTKKRRVRGIWKCPNDV